MFQYYFFAKSDLDLSIDFFLYLFCIFQKIILLPNIMFYPIVTTLDVGGGGAGITKNVTSAGSQLTLEGGEGRNNQKRYIRGVTTDLGRGGRQ